MYEKMMQVLYRLCDVFELLMAGAVACGIVVAAVTLWPEMVVYWENRMMPGAFQSYLGAVFNVVIGIEFMKMLCKPNSANIIEVLIFLIARHMIVHSTTPLDDLTSVVSISILFLFRRFMLLTKPGKDHHIPKIFSGIKAGQSPQYREAAMQAEEKRGEEGEG